MSDVFVSYARKDREAFEQIARALELEGLSVWDDHEIAAGEPLAQAVERELAAARCVVSVWSKAAAESEFVQEEIRRAVQGWATNRLALATLDDTPLPMGLRDLAPIPIGRSPSGVKQLAAQARSIASGAKPVARVAASASGGFALIEYAPLSVVTVLLVLGAFAVFSRLAGADLDWTTELLILLSVLVLSATVGFGAPWATAVFSPRKRDSMERGSRRERSLVDIQVFVSYSHQDLVAVDALVHQMEEMGYAVWIDRAATGSQRYAGPIVRAIRTARLVALMCSRDAFASDHVIREIYFAGDLKKPFIAFELDQSGIPDEVLYFVTGFPRIPVRSVNPERLRSEIARIIVA